MQLAAADGDFHHITAGVDMVGHQGEPWLIDLQDFTAGVWIGSQAMTRTTLSGIASGARGAVLLLLVGHAGLRLLQRLARWRAGGHAERRP